MESVKGDRFSRTGQPISEQLSIRKFPCLFASGACTHFHDGTLSGAWERDKKICLLVLSVSESTPITIRSLFQHDDFLSMADTVVIENHEVYSADSILQIGFP